MILFFKELCEYHVSGQLKVAPEHVADPVLQKMGKPENSVYQAFSKKYKQINEKLGKKQYLVTVSRCLSHPGSTMKEPWLLAEYLRDLGLYAGAGTGLLSDTVDDIDLYVLYGSGSADDGTCICTEKST